MGKYRLTGFDSRARIYALQSPPPGELPPPPPPPLPLALPPPPPPPMPLLLLPARTQCPSVLILHLKVTIRCIFSRQQPLESLHVWKGRNRFFRVFVSATKFGTYASFEHSTLNMHGWQNLEHSNLQEICLLLPFFCSPAKQQGIELIYKSPRHTAIETWIHKLGL